MILHFVPWKFLLNYNNYIFFTNKYNLKTNYIFKQNFNSCDTQTENKSNNL